MCDDFIFKICVRDCFFPMFYTHAVYFDLFVCVCVPTYTNKSPCENINSLLMDKVHILLLGSMESLSSPDYQKTSKLSRQREVERYIPQHPFTL